MSAKIFCFDPAKYAQQFAREGWVHIREGVTEDFYQKAVAQIEESMKSKTMKEFAIGDKQQAMYEFPEGGDYISEVCQTVGTLCGLPAEDVLMSERHVKAYDSAANPNPHAHKDRYASQISFGLSIHVKPGSTLVLYPKDELEINPFNTSVQLRASLSPDRYPEPRLAKGTAVEIEDKARDVIAFRGHQYWHLRKNAANTTMLYLKLNAFNCDPMGEDPRTPQFRERTLAAAELKDEQLEKAKVLIGRRVDFFHKHYSRDWQEIPGVVLWGEKHFTLDEDEWKMLQQIDGKKNVSAVVTSVNGSQKAQGLEKIRRLARRGVLDLIPA